MIIENYHAYAYLLYRRRRTVMFQNLPNILNNLFGTNATLYMAN